VMQVQSVAGLGLESIGQVQTQTSRKDLPPL
jgi:hypothetical protein